MAEREQNVFWGKTGHLKLPQFPPEDTFTSPSGKPSALLHKTIDFHWGI